MRLRSALAATLLAGTPFGVTYSENLPAEALAARSTFDERAAEARAPLAELKQKYLNALGALAEREQAAGRLDSLLEIRRIVEAAEAGAPADPPAVGGELGRLEEIYRRERARLEEQISQSLAPARAAYSAALEEVVTLLTREGRLEEALAVREELAALPAEGADAAPATAAPGHPDRATRDSPFENSLGMKFVPVPGSEVLFCIHPTRYKDYAVYAEETPGIAPNWKNQTFEESDEIERSDEHPAVNVSWEDAVAFCEWLSRREGRVYRLPTDAEWSLAVGLGRSESRSAGSPPAALSGRVPGEYPWGTRWPPPQGAGNYSDQTRRELAPNPGTSYIDGYSDGYPGTSPVMSFNANRIGLFDMGGNVWEWCEDRLDGATEPRVLRGASWRNPQEHTLRSSHRHGDPPSIRRDNNGFRVVLDLSPER